MSKDTDKIYLITFPKPKYGEQIVAVKNDTGLNLVLFDACDLFMTDGTWAERKLVQEQARKFAEKFVVQMNGEPTP